MIHWTEAKAKLQKNFFNELLSESHYPVLGVNGFVQSGNCSDFNVKMSRTVSKVDRSLTSK